MRKLLPLILLTIFILVALFGLPLTVPMSHDMECPFASGCVMAFEHVHHWQSAFVMILSQILFFIAVVAIFFFRAISILEIAQRNRLRYQLRIYTRPTLFQELFSNGILNRKEDCYA